MVLMLLFVFVLLFEFLSLLAVDCFCACALAEVLLARMAMERRDAGGVDGDGRLRENG